MAPPTFNFNVFMEKEKLATNGSNFTEWAMNLRILHSAAQYQYVLEAPLGPPPFEDAPDEEKNVYKTRQGHHQKVGGLTALLAHIAFVQQRGESSNSWPIR